MLRLNRLTLTDFRSYAALTWRPAARISVLYGPNGTGKTNLLEALSLIVPGRGLRSARNADLPRLDGPGSWAVAARFQTQEGETIIGTGCEPGSDRRVFRLDGAAPRNQADIARIVAAVWLTPQMDRLFQEGLSGRRRFLDRLVWALEPGHAREMAAHDTAVGSRNRLLSEGRHDRAWLSGLEDSIARHAVAASAARLSLVTRLNAQIAAGAGAFPPGRIGLACPIAERLQVEPALKVEDWLRETLAANRPRDSAAGTCLLGAHRTDMRLTDVTTGTPAALASTGATEGPADRRHPGARRPDRLRPRLRPLAFTRRTGGSPGRGAPPCAMGRADCAARADRDHRHGCRDLPAAGRPCRGTGNGRRRVTPGWAFSSPPN